ncbi:MAG: aminotransferase class I/II-fold pyridoxal phosphate-dependent enzyme [Candidatus Obscuribacterales bacterium]|nr:aminotransferase class I/II-fold pyridoxal phosphate-dependent enzyme [Candidatus Obscuribacterales bacterium]
MTALKVPLSETFLQNVKGKNAIAELSLLLKYLENESTRNDACSLLHDLARDLQLKPSEYGSLSLHLAEVPGLAEPVKLVLHSAVFMPEDWGQAFAEGLLKDPEIFRGKRIVELGTGSGWISLLLLHRTEVREILGLDINPIAVVIANLNKWLNGINSDGSLRLSMHGMPLIKAFHADVSDLLGKPLREEQKFDHVIGCIPQVLHPNLNAFDENREHLSDQELYDLSNYCFNQGILEDRFGLPLIARALEEAQLCLQPQGRVTLILGGRPGAAAIEEMFKRRGYLPELWWVRRIQQADDTDLAPLVSLENAYNIKFHFFSSHSSKYSIPASTAVKLQERGHKIFHDLLVYQASTRYEKPMLGFIRNLHKLKLEDLRKELDFSRISEEQVSFLERLTTELLNRKSLPYPHERGDLSLREKLSKFLAVYCYCIAQADDLFIGPERWQMLSMILSMLLQPGDKLLLSGSLDSLYGKTVNAHQVSLLLGNEDLSDLFELDDVFAPQLILLASRQLKDPSPLLLQALIQQAKKHPERWYIVDDSEHFEIGSSLHSNMLMRLIGQTSLPPNLIFLYGLVKNTVCPDFELSFLINMPIQWRQGLEVCAELSYSRISYLAQLYYEWLFDELLAFPFGGGDLNQCILPDKDLRSSQATTFFSAIAADPVFEPKFIDPEADAVIRFDYGEFENVIPDLLVKGLIKGFIEPPAEGMENIVVNRVAAYLQKTRQAKVDETRIVLGQGVFPLLGALMSAFEKRLERSPVVAIPKASYGLLFPMLSYFDAEIQLIETKESNQFQVEADDLKSLSRKVDILWLTQPNNPSGVYFEAEQIKALIDTCAEQEIYILADEIFFLLSDQKLGRWTPAELSFGHGKLNSQWVFYTDGLSKSFAAGGLRCGFLVCPDLSWAKAVREQSPLPPQSSLRAWDTLYSAFLAESPHQLIDVNQEFQQLENYLFTARSLLSEQREQLHGLLSKYDLTDAKLLTKFKFGGMFLLARLDDSAETIAKEKNLLLNPGAWGRMQPWARICFGLTPDKFTNGLKRLSEFLKSKFS